MEFIGEKVLGVLMILIIALTSNTYYSENTIKAYKNEQSIYKNYSPYLEQVDTKELGKAFAASSVNVSKFRQNAVLTVPEGTLVGFYDEYGQVKIILLTATGQTKSITISPNISKGLLGDGHSVISIGYLAGYVHVMYGAHVTKPYYAQFHISELTSKKTYLINAIEWPDTLTYPQFYNINNNLYLAYRHEKNIYLMEFKKEINLWDFKNARMLFDAGDDIFSVYVNDFAIRNNLLAIPFVFRLKKDNSSNIVQNDGIYLAYSSNFGVDFKSLNGDKLTLPIKRDSTEKVISIQPDKGLMNQDASIFSEDGILYFTHMNQNEQGIPQVYLSVINIENKHVFTEPVSKNSEKFLLEGAGTLVLPLSRAEIAVSDNYIHVIYRQNENMVIASSKKDKKGFPTGGWSYYVPTTKPLGAWEPNYNKVDWENDKRLIIYVQAVRQGESDKALGNEPSNASLYEFIEKK